MKLFMSGKKFETASDPPIVKRLKEFLRASKDGELFGTEQLAGLLLCCATSILKHKLRLEDFCYIYKGKKYWGSPATIKTLIKEVTKEKKVKL
jgi:hypothetical protein